MDKLRCVSARAGTSRPLRSTSSVTPRLNVLAGFPVLWSTVRITELPQRPSLAASTVRVSTPAAFSMPISAAAAPAATRTTQAVAPPFRKKWFIA